MSTSTNPNEGAPSAGGAVTADGQLTAQLVARIERIPVSPFHMRARFVVGTATFFDAFDGMTIAYIMPALIAAWKLKAVDISFMISTGYVGQIAGALFFGWLSERKGRMAALQWSVAVMSAFSLLCALSWDYNSLFVFRFIQGIGLGGEVPVAAAYINEIFKAKGRGRFVVLYEYLFIVGMFAASLLALLMVPKLGWQSMFVLGTLPAVLIIFMRRGLPESPRWLATHGRMEEAEKVVARIEESASRGGKVQLAPIVLREAMAAKKTRLKELFEGRYLRRTLTVWVMWFGAYFLTYGLQTWFPALWTRHYHLTISDALLWSTVTRAFSLVVNIIIAFNFDAIGRKVWFTGAFFLSAVCLIGLWLLGPATPFFTVYIITTIAVSSMGILSNALYAYNPELYPTRMRALGTSVSTSWLRISSAVGPIIVGSVMTAYSLNTVWLVFGLVVLISGIVTALFAVETRNRVLEEVSP
jgi:MFS transporter, putative metabolite:H+ symporter